MYNSPAQFQADLRDNTLSGCYLDVPEAAYRAAPGISQSDLKEMDISAAHYRQSLLETKAPTPDQIVGTLTHSLILCDREDFAIIPDDAPTRPTKAQLKAKKPSQDTLDTIAWWKKFSASHPGKEHLKGDAAERIYALRNAVFNHPIAAEILGRPGNNEVAGFKHDPMTGLLLRGRADRLTTDNRNYVVVPDLKTVQRGAAARREFECDIFKWGYHIQAAHYLDLFEASFFLFIVVEKEAPYAVATYTLDTDAIVAGRRKRDSLLARVKACEESGKWPAYPETLERISIPEWAKNRE